MSPRMARVLVFLLLSSAAATIRAQVRGQLPAGWEAASQNAGTVWNDYEVGVDRGVKHAGAASGYIRGAATSPQGFMALAQGFRADQYRGRRLKLAGYIRTQAVADGAALWVQLFGGGGTVGFDNMGKRPVKGTTDWTRCEIVLDVPESSAGVSFGFLLKGPGQAWFDDLTFEVVGQDVPTTNIAAANRTDPANRETEKAFWAGQPAQPVNLGFEDVPR